eukprot:6194382-Pleurochrysis_carterae.AAC.1
MPPRGQRMDARRKSRKKSAISNCCSQSCRKVKQGGGASKRRSLLEAKLKLLNGISCKILFKHHLHARRAFAERERGGGACPWEGSTRGGDFSPPLFVVWFVVLGGKKSSVCRPRSATWELAGGLSQERKSGRGPKAPLRSACVDAGA